MSPESKQDSKTPEQKHNEQPTPNRRTERAQVSRRNFGSMVPPSEWKIPELQLEDFKSAASTERLMSSMRVPSHMEMKVRRLDLRKNDENINLRISSSVPERYMPFGKSKESGLNIRPENIQEGSEPSDGEDTDDCEFEM